MARIFAQHAEAGEYHLETRYAGPDAWQWLATKTKGSVVEFSGDAADLAGAMKAAAAAIGLKSAEWRNIGPAIELPDSES